MLYCTRCGCEDQDKLSMDIREGYSYNVFANSCQCCNYTGVVKESKVHNNLPKISEYVETLVKKIYSSLKI